MRVKEDFHNLQFPRVGAGKPCRATQENTSISQEAAKSEGKALAFIVFSMGKARQNRGNSLGLASLNNPSRLCSLGVSLVVWYLAVVDLGQGKYWLGG